MRAAGIVQALRRVPGRLVHILRLEELSEQAVNWWLGRYGRIAVRTADHKANIIEVFELGRRIGYRDGRRAVGRLADLEWDAWCDSALAVARTGPVVPGQRVLRAVGGHR